MCFGDSQCARCQCCKKDANCKSKKLCSGCQEATPAISCKKCLNRAVVECVACKDCLACTKRLECLECCDERDLTSCKSCCFHFDCDNCRNYEWANRYGVQLTGPQAGLQHMYEQVQQVTMHTLALNDTAQWRFALLVGNSEYVSTIYKALKNPVNDIDALSEQLQQPSVGFEVRIMRNAKKDSIEDEVQKWAQMLPEDAVALIHFCGHGCELRCESYFVPTVCDKMSEHDGSADAVILNAKTNFVELSSVLSCVHRVLRRDGLILSFWDCCRKNDLNHNRDIKRGTTKFAPLIRDLEAFADKLDQLSYPDAPSEIAVCASSQSCLAFDGNDSDAHGPLASALLSLLANPELATLNLLDPRVKLHVGRQFEQRNGGKQRTEWIDNTKCAFAFVEHKELTGNDDTTSQDKNTLPATSAESGAASSVGFLSAATADAHNLRTGSSCQRAREGFSGLEPPSETPC